MIHSHISTRFQLDNREAGVWGDATHVVLVSGYTDVATLSKCGTPTVKAKENNQHLHLFISMFWQRMSAFTKMSFSWVGTFPEPDHLWSQNFTMILIIPVFDQPIVLPSNRTVSHSQHCMVYFFGTGWVIVNSCRQMRDNVTSLTTRIISVLKVKRKK